MTGIGFLEFPQKLKINWYDIDIERSIFIEYDSSISVTSIREK